MRFVPIGEYQKSGSSLAKSGRNYPLAGLFLAYD